VFPVVFTVSLSLSLGFTCRALLVLSSHCSSCKLNTAGRPPAGEVKYEVALFGRPLECERRDNWLWSDCDDDGECPAPGRLNYVVLESVFVCLYVCVLMRNHIPP